MAKQQWCYDTILSIFCVLQCCNARCCYLVLHLLLNPLALSSLGKFLLVLPWLSKPFSMMQLFCKMIFFFLSNSMWSTAGQFYYHLSTIFPIRSFHFWGRFTSSILPVISSMSNIPKSKASWWWYIIYMRLLTPRWPQGSCCQTYQLIHFENERVV